MDQPSVSSERQHAATLDVNVSLQDAQVRMRATTDVTRYAIDEIGRLSQHRATQMVITLHVVDRLVRDPRVHPLVTEEVSSHLLTMQRVYLRRLEVVENNASQRLIALSDWTPPSFGFFQSLLRLFNINLLPRKEPALLELADDVDAVTRAEDAEGDFGDDATDVYSEPDTVSDQRHHVPDFGFDPRANPYPNGSPGDIEGDGWRIINR